VVIDDHAETLSALGEFVKREGFTVDGADTVEKGRAAIAGSKPDVVLIDLNLPDGSGLDLLDQIDPHAVPAVVLITAHASVETAVEALRRGVTDYLVKPVDVDRLRAILSDITRTRGLKEEISELRQRMPSAGRFGLLVGRSEALLGIYDLISRVAPSNAAVLITGESGSGKEMVARTIHELSRRRHGPFVPVNCGAISPSLMESELFGHERGSFTGAERRHRGYFERAHRGTLFLDEVTEMPPELQVKLLRVLETGTFTRVGAETPITVDVRVVSASNRRIDEAVAKGNLREDLYYRLKVFQIHLPPLRDRPDDVEPLATHFLEELAKSEGRAKRLNPEVVRILQGYAWPGNVRELRNVLHSAFVLANDEIDPDCLPGEVRLGQPQAEFDGSSVRLAIGTPLDEMERRVILATLSRFEGNKVKTAEVLGISLKTLYNRLNSYEHQAVNK
jgi:DNA-binding NtrC family response regulator